MNALTIVARNYLAPARLLARTFLEHHRDGQFFVVVVDALPNDDYSSEPFGVISAFDVGIERDELLRMATMYDVTELATALKPFALRTVLGRLGGAVTYLDPDILVLAPLDELDRLAREHQIVLTPHVLSPIPRDGLMPNEEIIMMSGAYNLGYISVGEGSEPFLDWWCERLSRWAIIAPSLGLFTDQRWIDFVPSLFPCTIVRDRGYNAAYWNLHERPIGVGDSGFTAGGVPLKFFHYSGFDTSMPHLLSKHQGPTPRILLSESADLRKLCALVAAELAAVGHGNTKGLTYRFSISADGLELTTPLRRSYRDAVLRAEREGIDPPGHAFDPDSGFLDWLNEPVVGPIDHRVSRFLEQYYAHRHDLVQQFPDLNGDSAARLLHWARVDAGFRASVPAGLIPPDDPEPILVIDRDPIPGVNVIGYFEAELGVGEAGRLATAAVEASGVPLSTFTYRVTTSRQGESFRGKGPQGCPYDINLLCVNADQTPRAMQALGSDFTNRRYTVGMWFWEVEEFPKVMHSAFDVVDEIWAPTPFIGDVLRPLTDKPVLDFPLPVLAPSTPTSLERRHVGLPEGFVFLFVFDFLSVFERKNPLGLISAYTRAFSPSDGTRLVIKTINADKRPLDHEALLFAIGDRPDIEIISRYVTSAEMHAMTQLSDAYVSLHRSEGFGLTMAHAMAWGKPTIATGYSGNMAFMTPDNSYLVPYERVPVGPKAPPYPAVAMWADPDLDVAAQMMRSVFEDRDEAQRRGRRAAADIVEKRSARSAARFVRERFDQLQAR